MSAVNFSANGTRWRVLPIDEVEARKPREPALPGTGLLFTSNEADVRFLTLAPDAVPTSEYLQKKSVAELAAMVGLAKPLTR